MLETRLDLFDGGGAAAGDGTAAGGGEAGQAGGIGGPKKGPGTGDRGGKRGGPAVLYGKQAGGGTAAGAGGPSSRWAESPMTRAGASAGGAGAGGQSGAGQSAVVGGTAAGNGEAGETGGTGGHEKEPGIQTSSDTLEERQRRWRELTGGEFKDLYDQEVQRLVSRSAREAAGLREQAGRMQPILDMLLDRYKIRDGDMGKLRDAVENDDAYWSQAAEEAGMSVDQYKRFQKLQRQNAQLMRAQQQRLGQERAENQLRAWNDQAEQLKAVYPSFDLSREIQNRDFMSMLRSGVPVRQAFEVIHMDEIRAATAAMQAKATEKAVTDNIKAKGARPQENGTGASSGFTVKDDVSRLTAKDRAEIARRVARGETITF